MPKIVKKSMAESLKDLEKRELILEEKAKKLDSQLKKLQQEHQLKARMIDRKNDDSLATEKTFHKES